MINMTLISKNVTLCNTLFSKGTGLMLTRKRDDFAYVFTFSRPRKILITMFLVFYPIDLIFLDKQGVIVDLKGNLKPFKNYASKVKSNIVIELPKGTIEKYFLEKGVKIDWNSEEVISNF